jgi:hypothetical protein
VNAGIRIEQCPIAHGAVPAASAQLRKEQWQVCSSRPPPLQASRSSTTKPNPSQPTIKIRRNNFVKRITFLLLAVTTLASLVAFSSIASVQADENASPIYGVKIPAGYRDWKLIAVNQLLVPG